MSTGVGMRAMINVQCEACQAPYRVDERRIPAAGMKMRCPQCSAVFMVQPPVPAADAAQIGELVDLPAAAAPKPVAQAKPEPGLFAVPPSEPLELADLPTPKHLSDLPMRKSTGERMPPPVPGKRPPAVASPSLEVAPVRDELPELPLPKMRGGDLSPSVPGLDAVSLATREAGDVDIEPPRASAHVDLALDFELRPMAAPASTDASAETGALDAPPISVTSRPPLAVTLPESHDPTMTNASTGGSNAQWRAQRLSDRASVGRRRLAKRLLAASVALALLGAAGTALKWTPYGAFGMYALEQFLPAAGDPARVAAVIEQADALAEKDTYADVRAALALLGEARRDAGLNRTLLVHSLLHEAMYQVRFDGDAASTARAGAILARLEERGGDAPGMLRALAAHALARGDNARAQTHLDAARATHGQDPFLALVEGELALRRRDGKAAKAAFAEANARGAGVRALWDEARAMFVLDAAVVKDPQSLDPLLAVSPQHAGARVRKAALLALKGRTVDAADLARQLLEPNGRAIAGRDRAGAHAVLGWLAEGQGDLSRAASAYDHTLRLDGRNVDGLLGAGRVLMRESRFGEALARFEAALPHIEAAIEPPLLSPSPVRTEATLWAARALFALHRHAEARNLLTALVGGDEQHADAWLWLGKVEQALGQYREAEVHLARSVELVPSRIEGYLALAQLHSQQGDAARSVQVLSEAERQVDETTEMRQMLGRAELARKDLPQAVRSFRRALELDPKNLEASFGLAVALRKLGRLQEASTVFEHLVRRNANFADLAEERGRLYEAQGAYPEAIAAYEAALAQRPDDTELRVRLGAVQVADGRIEAAEQALLRVMRDRPSSAEVEYLLGRTAFARGRFPDAMSHFERSLNLDVTRAETHLYAAWTSFEMGNLGRALEASEAAITRDAGLADAFWLRGVVRLRAGAVQDALVDLKRAVDMHPGRFEAYAAMGDCYDQLRRLDDAARAYERALRGRPEQALWWYRLGRLHLDAGKSREVVHTLERATALGAAQPSPPLWLADAYRMYGEALRMTGQRSQAIQQYQRFLELAPPSALDRADVERTLRRWNIDG